MLGSGERTFRPVGAAEITEARAHLERLDDEDQFHHFHQFMDKLDFDAWQERAAEHDLIGCFAEGRLVGLAEIAYRGHEAELALSVDAGMRGRGIGTELFELACASASAFGAKTLSILVTRGDREMLDMAVRHDGFTAFKREQSLLMPGTPHTLLCWLSFDLAAQPDRGVFARMVRSVRRSLGLEEGRTTRDLASYD